jgi:hypothetical protein
MRALDFVHRITWLEVSVAIVAGAVALVHLQGFLSLESDRAIFNAFIIPVELFVIPSAISLVRSASRKETALSPLGYFAMGWPALSFMLLHPIFYVCVPIGIGLTLFAVVSPRRKLPADGLPFFWNAAWFGLALLFSASIWSVYDAY